METRREDLQEDVPEYVPSAEELRSQYSVLGDGPYDVGLRMPGEWEEGAVFEGVQPPEGMDPFCSVWVSPILIRSILIKNDVWEEGCDIGDSRFCVVLVRTRKIAGDTWRSPHGHCDFNGETPVNSLLDIRNPYFNAIDPDAFALELTKAVLRCTARFMFPVS